jgi:2-keto-4-pentenoate hydratase/2-oxohepta-3-ene-1,7-dioic acid hydratase in catechol pathway
MAFTLKAFSFAYQNGTPQIGVDINNEIFNFSLAWELYKQFKSQGKGPRLDFLQIMVEADFFNLETIEEVMDTLKGIRPVDDLKIKKNFGFHPPIGRPQKILCMGRNYKAHAQELGNPVPEEPIFFSKSPSSLLAHEKAIQIPKGVGRVDFEGEFVVVIGKRAARVSESKAFDFVTGFSILNDVTARELQKKDVKEGKPWFRAKSFDTFCPFGPYLVPVSSVRDYHNLKLQVRVNGEVKQETELTDMIFDVPEIISYFSEHCTLEPGDVIATGTPAGVGPLSSGDVVECEITEIGTLRNSVE